MRDKTTTIKQQETYGIYNRNIHLRMRDRIAQKLGVVSDEFIAVADNYGPLHFSVSLR